MIAILAMSSKYEKVFSNTRKLLTSLCNCLKENIIETSEYLGT